LNPEALREYRKLHPDKILQKIRQTFGANDASVLDGIMKLGITYKKIILSTFIQEME
jgi:hypothetical protein